MSIKFKDINNAVKQRFGKHSFYIYNNIINALKNNDKDYYYILGYGSLLNRYSTLTTMPKAKDCGFIYLEGYERVFDMGWGNGAFLNIRPKTNSSIIVRKWKINKEEFEEYLIREGLYDLKYNEELNAYYVMNTIHEYHDDILPSLNYIRTCISNLDAVGKENFWNTTYNKNGEKTIDYIRRLL